MMRPSNLFVQVGGKPLLSSPPPTSSIPPHLRYLRRILSSTARLIFWFRSCQAHHPASSDVVIKTTYLFWGKLNLLSFMVDFSIPHIMDAKRSDRYIDNKIIWSVGPYTQHVAFESTAPDFIYRFRQ